jgi:aldehyde dehydrogenase (NAD+)
MFPPSTSGFLWSERRPRGVAGLITPWNFPMAIPLWKAAPALAAGNAVVLKPSPDAIAGALFVRDVLNEFLPANLFTVVVGEAEVGAALVNLADVVSFTGSNSVGAQIAVEATKRGIPVQAEMGGQNAAIILPDADPASTAAMIASASMWFAGQKCTCTRRVITVGDNREFLDALVAAVNGLKVGDPADAANQVGPLINERSLHNFERALNEARELGAEVLAGGNTSEGLFVQPTVLAGVPINHPLSCNEVFGPLITVHAASTVAEAIEMAESVRYGLVTSVHGKDHNSLIAVAQQVETGMIKINAPTTGVDFYAPFGGERDSSIGMREQGTAALDFYSSVHTVTYSPAP